MRTIPGLISLLLLAACGDDGSSTPSDSSDTTVAGTTESSSGADAPAGTDDTATPPPTSSGETATGDDTGAPGSSDGADATSSTGSDEPLPPTDGAQLLPWLEAGEYLSWTAESGVHPSDGPHFGGVRTFVNSALLGSLEAGSPMHPLDAAAVKELYGPGDAVRGWSVAVKVQADSAGGAGWYWFEIYDDTQYADGTGLTLCTDCHGAGIDYVMSPFPLQ